MDGTFGFWDWHFKTEFLRTVHLSTILLRKTISFNYGTFKDGIIDDRMFGNFHLKTQFLGTNFIGTISIFTAVLN